jgi:hypothetical protein
MTVTGYPAPLHDYPGGVANSAGAIESGVANAVMGWRQYTLNTATSGHSLGSRFQHYVAGAAGSGSAIRGYALVKGVQAANLYGGEFSAEVMSTASSAISGLIAGLKSDVILNLNAGGTAAALDLNFTVASGKSASATTDAFIRVGNAGTGTGCINLLNITTAIGSASATDLITTSADKEATHMVRMVVGGTVIRLLATTNAPS